MDSSAATHRPSTIITPRPARCCTALGAASEGFKEIFMNSLSAISILCWIATLVSFHTGHPLGHVTALLGLAAAAAIADGLSTPPRRR
jgi:hypothetical protein